MKGNPKVIEVLNKVLRNELTAVNQYFLHARMADDWGFKKLGNYIFHESIDEMKHADKIVKRVLFLEGLPNLQDIGKLMIGQDVPEILKNDLGTEMQARTDVVAAITVCEEVADYESRQILQVLLDETEEHIDWLETQIALVDSVGIHNYLQSQMQPAS